MPKNKKRDPEGMRVSNRLGKMPGIYGLTNGAGVQGPVLQAEEGTEL